jgi:hypothetical protein
MHVDLAGMDLGVLNQSDMHVSGELTRQLPLAVVGVIQRLKNVQNVLAMFLHCPGNVLALSVATSRSAIAMIIRPGFGFVFSLMNQSVSLCRFAATSEMALVKVQLTYGSDQ